MPLFYILKAMGVTDYQMQEAWGDDITNTNLRKNDSNLVKKLHAKLMGNSKPVENVTILDEYVCTKCVH